jgi:ABC-2 type transport system ATP-binding protein
MIEVKNLTKRYGNHCAVNNISFQVGEGEILGFLFDNGRHSGRRYIYLYYLHL